MSESDNFIRSLTYVMRNLRTCAVTQIPGLVDMWHERFGPTKVQPEDFTKFDMHKEKFQQDLEYRKEILAKVNAAQHSAYRIIRDSMIMLFQEYLRSPLFKDDFPSAADQKLVPFELAKLFLGTLREVVRLNRKAISIGYIIFAHQYYGFKQGISLNKLKEKLRFAKIEVTDTQITKTLDGLTKMGFIIKESDEDGGVYKLLQEPTLSPEGQRIFDKKLKTFVEKAVGIYRTIYDVRTLDTPIPESYPMRDYLAKTVQHAATQGYTSASQVVKFILEYYKKTE